LKLNNVKEGGRSPEEGVSEWDRKVRAVKETFGPGIPGESSEKGSLFEKYEGFAEDKRKKGGEKAE